MGVPQGSVLGPLLFLIYINDMPLVVQHSKLRLFADDSLIYKQINTHQDSLDLQKVLNNLVVWSGNWQMNFNISKCEHMRISRQSCSSNTLIPTYTFNGSDLTHVDSIKYLGVNIDNCLSFERHILEICRKATRTLHMLMRCLKKAKPKTRAMAFKSICKPILEYSSHCCSPYKEKHIKNIENINRKAYRWVNNKTKYDCISELMSEDGWPTLAERRHKNDINFYFKILSGTAAVDTSTISVLRPSGHQTRIGGLEGTISTNTQKYSYKHRLNRFITRQQI